MKQKEKEVFFSKNKERSLLFKSFFFGTIAKIQKKHHFWSIFNKITTLFWIFCFSILIFIFILLFYNNNIIETFKNMFSFAFDTKKTNQFDNTFYYWAIYILAGLAVFLCFKIGLFNIGVSGQMLASGISLITISRLLEKYYKDSFFFQSYYITFVFFLLVAIISSLVVGFITVFLKVKFNVNEVLSCIFLNWIIWYFAKWLINQDSRFAANGASLNIMRPVITQNINNFHYKFFWPLLFSIFLLWLFYVIFKETIIGYKAKIVLSNNSNLIQYSGVRRNYYYYFAFLSSAIISGILGFFYYAINEISFIRDELPLVGFEGIVVAFISQNSFIFLFFVSFIIAFLKSSLGIVQINTVNDPGQIIHPAVTEILFGIIIGFSAVAVIFTKFKPLSLIVHFLKQFPFWKRKFIKWEKQWHIYASFWVLFLEEKKKYQEKIKSKRLFFFADTTEKEKKLILQILDKEWEEQKKILFMKEWELLQKNKENHI